MNNHQAQLLSDFYCLPFGSQSSHLLQCDDAESTIESMKREVSESKNKMKWEMTSVVDLLKTSQVSWSQKMQRKNAEIRELSKELQRLQAG